MGNTLGFDIGITSIGTALLNKNHHLQKCADDFM